MNTNQENDRIKFNIFGFCPDCGNYHTTHNEDNWKCVDYVVDEIIQPEDVKRAAFEKMLGRFAHNIWVVVSFEGTRRSLDMCEELEKALQDGQAHEFMDGFIVANGTPPVLSESKCE